MVAEFLDDESSKEEQSSRNLNAYRDERYPLAKAAVQANAGLARAIKPGFAGDLISMIKPMPRWLWLLARSKVFCNRPQISFLPRADDKGTSKPHFQPCLSSDSSKNSDTPAA
ncbi:hypothetical protein BGZ76_006714 [Entomortierella beljakovae]|nr:hypothetical protein BGZ76_006714 [Entomortierella beljakovae]